MSRRTTYHTQASSPTWTDSTSPPQTTDDLTQRLRAATVAGVTLATILLVFTISIVLWLGTFTLRSFVVAFAACAVIGLLYSSYLAFRWSLTVAEREWQIDDKERARRWALEDEERIIAQRFKDNAAQQATDQKAVSLAHIPVLALELLRRHYLGKRTSRAACVHEGICTAGDWNLVNGVFKSLGMKTGYTLTPGDDLVHAWATWEKNVKVENGHVWIASQTGWTLVE